MLKKKYFKTKNECEVTFEFESDDVQTVALVTEANDWQPVEMKKRKKDGVFYYKIRLPQETHVQFRYLLDGNAWINDSAADAFVPNEFGGQNGVVSTGLSAN